MILGYLNRKINVLLLVFIITGCSNINTNNLNIYDDIFVAKEVNCPLINTPKGSEELIAISQINNNTSYIGFRGIKKNCSLSGDKIKMNLTVNLRSVEKIFKMMI